MTWMKRNRKRTELPAGVLGNGGGGVPDASDTPGGAYPPTTKTSKPAADTGSPGKTNAEVIAEIRALERQINKTVSPAPVSSANDDAVFQKYLDELNAVYQPEKLVAEVTDEQTFKEQIASWLRPAYDAAIARRQSLTDAYHAELDADAIARGMGASTYVTDVKSRQKNAEALDISNMEGEYGAALSKYVFDAVEKERARAHEIALFNSEREHEAYLTAYEKALSKFAAYKAGQQAQARRQAAAATAKNAVPVSSPEDCAAFMSGLTRDEKMNVFRGVTEEDRQYRKELIASVGVKGLFELMHE